MPKKRVLCFSIYDWANSMYKMCEAVNRNSTDYECCYMSVYSHPFGYDRGGHYLFEHRDKEHANISQSMLELLREYTETCDALHIKEDRGLLEKVYGVDMPLHKPTMITFCGSTFRNHDRALYNAFKNSAAKLTVTTPNLRVIDGVEVPMDIIPFAVDGQKYRPSDRSQDIMIVGHMPSNGSTKGTDIIMPAMENVANKYPGRMYPITANGMPFYLNLEYKRVCHIYVDQIAHGAYGNSAVEAMAFGSVVMAKSDFGCPGVVNIQDGPQLEAELERLLNEPEYYDDWAAKCYSWFISYHDFTAVAQRVEKMYDEILGITHD